MFIRCPPCDTRTRSQALASSSASQQGQWTAATKHEPALSGCVHVRQAAPPSTITQVLPFGATCLTTCCTWSPREHSLIWALKSDNEGCAHFATQSDVFHHNRCGEPYIQWLIGPSPRVNLLCTRRRHQPHEACAIRQWHARAKLPTPRAHIICRNFDSAYYIQQ